MSRYSMNSHSSINVFISPHNNFTTQSSLFLMYGFCLPNLCETYASSPGSKLLPMVCMWQEPCKESLLAICSLSPPDPYYMGQVFLSSPPSLVWPWVLNAGWCLASLPLLVLLPSSLPLFLLLLLLSPPLSSLPLCCFCLDWGYSMSSG